MNSHSLVHLIYKPRKLLIKPPGGYNLMRYKDIPILRNQLLKEQEHICPLCEQYINIADSAVDHCHIRGNIRKVLHKSCNLYISSIENKRVINRIDDIKFENIMKNIVGYINDLREEIHPIHLKKKRKSKRPNPKK